MSEHKAPLAKRKALGLVGIHPKRLREEAARRRREADGPGRATIMGGAAEFMLAAAALARTGRKT